MEHDPKDWRARYLDLLKDGEARGFKGTGLGFHIARGLSDADLRQMLRDHHEHLARVRYKEADK